MFSHSLPIKASTERWCWQADWLIGRGYLKRGNRSRRQAGHRTVTIRQIWIASKDGPRWRCITCTLSRQANRGQPHRTVERFIVRRRGLNRAFGHEKYGQRNNTLLGIVIRQRLNVETVNLVRMKRPSSYSIEYRKYRIPKL